MIFLLFFFLIFFVLILLSVAYITLLERHLLGLSQERLGPSKNLMFGFLQPFIDALKLFQKYNIFPYSSSFSFYLFIPIFFFFIFFLQFPMYQGSLMSWSFDTNYLYLICVMGTGVFCHFFIGFFSVSKYSSMGAMRAVIQSVSYEVVFFFVLFMMMNLSFSFCSFLMFSFLSFIFIFIFIFLIMSEVGRAPFDFTEGESELVSGYNLEYSSLMFVFLFLSEYGLMLLFCVFLSGVLFSWDFFFIFPVPVFLVVIILLFRSAYPRYRYDFLMSFFWFLMLPISMHFNIFLFSFFLY